MGKQTNSIGSVLNLIKTLKARSKYKNMPIHTIFISHKDIKPLLEDLEHTNHAAETYWDMREHL